MSEIVEVPEQQGNSEQAGWSAGQPSPRGRRRDWRTPLLLVLVIICFYWKLTLTRQFTFLAVPDEANQVLPWLQVDVTALRDGSIPLWNPWEWAGQSLVGQVQPAVLSPFTWLLALTPLKGGHLQIQWVNRWLVLIHVCAALFAWFFLRDLRLGRPAAFLGAALYATSSYVGSTDWPQMLAAAIWAPLVFLFLFRAARGRRPWASSCLAGLFLGIAWLCGHHGPALLLSLAAAATFLAILWRAVSWRYKAGLAACFVGVTGLVAAVQLLPAFEYGRLALRWTLTGEHRWDQRVGFREHVQLGLRPFDIVHVFLPGLDAYNPFLGAVALSLAVLAVCTLLRRAEVRIFTILAIVAFLYTMPEGVAWYGPLYALVPMLDKVRTPQMATSIFELAMITLAAFGCDELLRHPARQAVRRVTQGAACFGFGWIVLLLLADAFRPTVTSGYVSGDARGGMIAIAALLFSATCLALARGLIRPSSAAVALCAIALMEQSNISGFSWASRDDPGYAKYLKPFEETEDVAAWLRLHRSGRISVNMKDIPFNFGNWYGIDALEAYDASMPELTYQLAPWATRTGQLLGLRYIVSRAPTRDGQKEVFSGAAGYKIFEDVSVLPRVWTVHNLRAAANDAQAGKMIRDETWNLATDAVISGPPPPLETCGDTDRIDSSRFQLQSVSVVAEMGCRGMVVVSDAWFPGWVASVDGNTVPIERVDLDLRGIAVAKGRHSILMRYRPASFISGVVLLLIGIGATAFAVWRDRECGPDLLTSLGLPEEPERAPYAAHE